MQPPKHDFNIGGIRLDGKAVWQDKADEPLELSSRISRPVVDSLIGMSMFDKLSVKDLDAISKHMNLIEVEPGEIVFNEGDPGDYVCFVVKGHLEVIKKAENGQEVALCKLRRNSSIGEMAVIDDFLRSATVRALSTSSLVTLTRKAFNRILGEHPLIGIQILKGISRLLSLNLRKTSSRLADYMLPLS
jgi:CRP/FNR family transcriptional regulator, cyclic AMP receptor protein